MTRDMNEIRAHVERALEGLRPYLQSDGGDVSLEMITPDMVVHVQLHGACETCPFSEMTMANGIEEAIKRSVPEIKRVITHQSL